MYSLVAFLVIGCLIGAYFSRGWTRAMLILLAVAVIQLKSVAVGMKLFSLTLVVIVLVYFLRPKKKR